MLISAEELGIFLNTPVFGISALRLLLSLVVLLVFLLLRKPAVRWAGKITAFFMRRIKTEYTDRILAYLKVPARVLFVAIGAAISVMIWDLPTSSKAVADRLIKSAAIILVSWVVYRLMKAILSVYRTKLQTTGTKIDYVAVPFVNIGIKIFIFIIGFILVIQQWKVNVTGLIAGLGLGGLAIALAAQDALANLFGSLMIMLDKPFAIGDWISTPNVEGAVEDIGFRSTKVRTYAQALVSIPNSALSKDFITNWSRIGRRRITLKLNLDPGTASALVALFTSNIRQMLKKHAHVIDENIIVFFEKFANGSFEILISYFIDSADYIRSLEIQEDINLRILSTLEEMKINIYLPSFTINPSK